MKLKDIIVKTAQTAAAVTVAPIIARPISKIVEQAVSKSTQESRASHHIQEDSSAVKVLKEVAKISSLGRVAVDAYDVKKKVDNINEAKKEINDSIARAKRLNDIVQEDLGQLGELKTEILSSFSTFCDCMERFQERPEIRELKCKDVSLPPFSLKELETSSIDAKKIIQEVVKKQFSWSSIALFGNATVLSTIAISTLPIFSLSLITSGLINNKKSSDDEIWNEIENNRNKINQIIKRLSELDGVVLDFYNLLNTVYGYYNSKIEDIEDIIAKYSKSQTTKISWNKMNEEEKLTIENCILFVGLLYEMCKIQVVKVDNNKEQIVINYTQKNEITTKAETIIRNAA